MPKGRGSGQSKQKGLLMKDCRCRGQDNKIQQQNGLCRESFLLPRSQYM